MIVENLSKILWFQCFACLLINSNCVFNWFEKLWFRGQNKALTTHTPLTIIFLSNDNVKQLYLSPCFKLKNFFGKSCLHVAPKTDVSDNFWFLFFDLMSLTAWKSLHSYCGRIYLLVKRRKNFFLNDLKYIRLYIIFATGLLQQHLIYMETIASHKKAKQLQNIIVYFFLYQFHNSVIIMGNSMLLPVT